MAKRQPRSKRSEIVRAFGARLRELRRSRGMTQADLATAARATAAYVWRLEAGDVSPGLDVLDRLAKALGTTAADLLPAVEPPDTEAAMREQSRKLFESLLGVADGETFSMLNPLLARLLDAERRR
jgi:transcriptional regulator with XRE-family HTH domain